MRRSVTMYSQTLRTVRRLLENVVVAYVTLGQVGFVMVTGIYCGFFYPVMPHHTLLSLIPPLHTLSHPN